jgi:hypothetical protein
MRAVHLNSIPHPGRGTWLSHEGMPSDYASSACLFFYKVGANLNIMAGSVPVGGSTC